MARDDYAGALRLLNGQPNEANAPLARALAQRDKYGRIKIGGNISLADVMAQLPQGVAETAADIIPGSAQERSIQRLVESYSQMQSASNPISKTLRGADTAIEGLGLGADFIPGLKMAGAAGAALVPLMMRNGGKFNPLAQALAKQRGMVGYHGSPHKFDKFQMDKIGTGEGAQAYGHGLYFAENPGVANSYKGVGEGRYKRNSGHLSPKAEFAYDFMEHGDSDIKVMERMVQQYGADADFDEINAAIKEARALDPSPGHLYEVDIPDEHVKNFLDWDAPLSEQGDEIASDLSHIIGEEMDRLGLNPATDIKQFHKRHPNGASLYRALINQKGGKAQASEFLRGRGIPGIKYYDGNSRTAGKGTSNFVVFDENDMTILTRNGESVAQSADSLPIWADELKSVGSKIDDDGTVLLYHATTKENAEKIRKSGKLLRPADAPDSYGVYLGSNPGVAESYGDGTVVAVRVKASDLHPDDIFPGERMDFSVKTRGGSYTPVSIEQVPAQSANLLAGTAAAAVGTGALADAMMNRDRKDF